MVKLVWTKTSEAFWIRFLTQCRSLIIGCREKPSYTSLISSRMLTEGSLDQLEVRLGANGQKWIQGKTSVLMLFHKLSMYDSNGGHDQSRVAGLQRTLQGFVQVWCWAPLGEVWVVSDDEGVLWRRRWLDRLNLAGLDQLPLCPDRTPILNNQEWKKSH